MKTEAITVKVLVAIDSFKGSLTSLEAGKAVKCGILSAMPEAQVTVRAVADGGEGTTVALTSGIGGTFRTVSVTGPLGDAVEATYGVSEDGNTAVIEMSEAAGLPLVDPAFRNPLHTTTYGVGEMINDAVKNGCRRFVVGIGGSATNDGGVGMLQALGFDMLDEQGQPIPFGAKGLDVLCAIRRDRVDPVLSDCEFLVACDVDNPLCGENGCSAVFAPQKGADAAMIADMDAWLSRYAELSKTVEPAADATAAGAGAAGGMGFALCTFLHATLKKGIDLVLGEIRLERDIADSDIVVTGEGRLDAQTAMGKTPAGVARLAKRCGKPVIALGGGVTDGAAVCHDIGIDAMFPVVRGVCSLEDAMTPETAKHNIAATAEQIFRLIRCFQK